MYPESENDKFACQIERDERLSQTECLCSACRLSIDCSLTKSAQDKPCIRGNPAGLGAILDGISELKREMKRLHHKIPPHRTRSILEMEKYRKALKEATYDIRNDLQINLLEFFENIVLECTFGIFLEDILTGETESRYLRRLKNCDYAILQEIADFLEEQGLVEIENIHGKGKMLFLTLRGARLYLAKANKERHQ